FSRDWSSDVCSSDLSTWGDPNPGIGVAVADQPAGPFIDHGKVFTSDEIDVPNSIDAFYFEEKGEKYLFWGSFSNAPTQGTYAVRSEERRVGKECVS